MEIEGSSSLVDGDFGRHLSTEPGNTLPSWHSLITIDIAARLNEPGI